MDGNLIKISYFGRSLKVAILINHANKESYFSLAIEFI